MFEIGAKSDRCLVAGVDGVVDDRWGSQTVRITKRGDGESQAEFQQLFRLNDLVLKVVGLIQIGMCHAVGTDLPTGIRQAF